MGQPYFSYALKGENTQGVFHFQFTMPQFKMTSPSSIARCTHISSNNEPKGYLISEDLGAVKADAAHDREHSLNESNVEHRLGKLKVSKVAWALCHPCHACLALNFPVNSPQSRVTKPTRLRFSPLHGLCVFYLNHRHLSLHKSRKKSIVISFYPQKPVPHSPHTNKAE